MREERRKRHLYKAARFAVRQGGHDERIIQYYSILIQAALEEFTEDNMPTLHDYLETTHREALKRCLRFNPEGSIVSLTSDPDANHATNRT